MDIRFYRLSRSSTVVRVARLAEQVVKIGHKITIICPNDVSKVKISDAIWTNAEFLPHNVEGDDGLSKVSIATEATDKHDIVFVVDDATFSTDIKAERICLMFHAADQDIVRSKRELWKKLSSEGDQISYWAENEMGAWNKEAESNTVVKN